MVFYKMAAICPDFEWSGQLIKHTYLVNKTNLCDFSSHKLDDFSRQWLIIFSPVSELSVTTGPERKNSSFLGQAQGVFLSTDNVNNVL